jgi:hypothetical protein
MRCYHARRRTAESGPHARTRGIVSAPTRQRRTIVIQGRPGPVHRLAQIERRRPPRRSVERFGARPDRVAMWAFLFGVLLVAVALLTSH